MQQLLVGDVAWVTSAAYCSIRARLLLTCLCCPSAAPAQQPAQQARSTSAAPAPAKNTSAPKTATASAVDEINKLPCERVKCSVFNLDPVCAVGEGVAGCKPADKGCTYTNGCMARCVYGAKVAYLGECKHEGAMRIAEDAGQGRGAPAKRDCKCDWKFEPVCASIPACTIPGGGGVLRLPFHLEGRGFTHDCIWSATC